MYKITWLLFVANMSEVKQDVLHPRIKCIRKCFTHVDIVVCVVTFQL